MIPALIGLIGVIAGALLGGIVNFVVDRQKQRRVARASGVLVDVELKAALVMVEAAAKERSWWPGELATDAWEQHSIDFAIGLTNPRPGTGESSREDSGSNVKGGSKIEEGSNKLAGESPRHILERLGAAYANLHSWNVRRAVAARHSHLDIGDEAVKELLQEAAGLRAVRQSLAEDLKRLATPRPLRAVRRWLVIAAVAVVALLLLVPHQVVNSTTVAAALQSGLGDRVFVRCEPNGDNWSCTEYQLSAPRSNCPVGISSTAAAPLGGQTTVAVQHAADAQCVETGPPSKEDVSIDDSGRIEETPAGGGARATNRVVMNAPGPEKKSWVWQAVTYLTGG
jgi:hypothetical protein